MKERRHAKILELIAEKEINTQDELLKCLRDCHFNVTQATVSRDIKELRLVKQLTPEGGYRYASAKKPEVQTQHDKYVSLLSNSVQNVDYAGNTVVVKCSVGTAQAACMAIDNMNWDAVVGTLAGDDTIFILMRTEQDAGKMMEQLYSFIRR